MKKVAKIKGLVSRPLQIRYLEADEHQRHALRETVEQESRWMLAKMRRKGYQLEATVAGVYGVFTRGPAVGTVRLASEQHEEVTSA